MELPLYTYRTYLYDLSQKKRITIHEHIWSTVHEYSLHLTTSVYDVTNSYDIEGLSVCGIDNNNANVHTPAEMPLVRSAAECPAPQEEKTKSTMVLIAHALHPIFHIYHSSLAPYAKERHKAFQRVLRPVIERFSALDFSNPEKIKELVPENFRYSVV